MRSDAVAMAGGDLLMLAAASNVEFKIVKRFVGYMGAEAASRARSSRGW